MRAILKSPPVVAVGFIPASFCTVGGLLREIPPSAHIAIGEGGPRLRLGRPQSGRGVSARRRNRKSTPPLPPARVLPNLARYAILSRNFENECVERTSSEARLQYLDVDTTIVVDGKRCERGEQRKLSASASERRKISRSHRLEAGFSPAWARQPN